MADKSVAQKAHGECAKQNKNLNKKRQQIDKKSP